MYSGSNASSNEQAVLTFLPWPFVVAFVAVSLALFAVMFPQHSLRHLVLTITQPQKITYYYLVQLIQYYPQDQGLHIALIQQEIGLHHFAAAKEHIGALEKESALKDKLAMLQYQLQYAQAFALPKGPKQQAAFAGLRTSTKAFLAKPLSRKQLLDFGDIALSINDPQDALVFYQRAGETSDPVLLAHIAKTALATSQYAISAHYYMLAADHEAVLPKRRAYVVSALKALQAGKQFDKGIAIIVQLPEEVVNDESMLMFLSQYALAADRPDLSEKYAKRALFMHGPIKP